MPFASPPHEGMSIGNKEGRPQGCKIGNFQGGAPSANLGGSGGPSRNFFLIWPLIRAFSDFFWGGAGFARGGARPFCDAKGGRTPPCPPLILRLWQAEKAIGLTSPHVYVFLCFTSEYTKRIYSYLCNVHVINIHVSLNRIHSPSLNHKISIDQFKLGLKDLFYRMYISLRYTCIIDFVTYRKLMSLSIKFITHK